MKNWIKETYLLITITALVMLPMQESIAKVIQYMMVDPGGGAG
ncbi:hypothetical protein QUG02_27690 [Bacillus hominis]|uniref:Uncharacterized protein n=1 Tax=Bacillus hominis TaxID=2817478 RepID=A0ABT7RFT6_9BACI|nr:hypothetical protein [Bacillus hominis]MDM5436248.1 hypothetical protein [Bacillus hominis]MDM5441796.1 hypothetical protein [Bacillus hominis]